MNASITDHALDRVQKRMAGNLSSMDLEMKGWIKHWVTTHEKWATQTTAKILVVGGSTVQCR